MPGDRARKYSYDVLIVLRRGWAWAGDPSGKYLAAGMALLLDLLERAGELTFGRGRYSPGVRGELITMSAATIDRLGSVRRFGKSGVCLT